MNIHCPLFTKILDTFHFCHLCWQYGKRKIGVIMPSVCWWYAALQLLFITRREWFLLVFTVYFGRDKELAEVCVGWSRTWCNGNCLKAALAYLTFYFISFLFCPSSRGLTATLPPPGVKLKERLTLHKSLFFSVFVAMHLHVPSW